MTLCLAIVIDMDYTLKQNKNIDIWYYTIKIREIISVGGDADTNACIVGSIIGLKVGFKGIPKNWINKTQFNTWLNNKIKKFIKMYF